MNRVQLESWINIKTEKDASNAVSLGIGTCSCVICVGTVVISYSLWKGSNESEYLFPLIPLYGLLALSFYKKCRSFVVVGVVVYFLLVLLGVKHAIAQDFKNGFPVGSMDVMLASGLIQGARGTFYYHRFQRLRAPYEPSASATRVQTVHEPNDVVQRNLRLHDLAGKVVRTYDDSLTAYRSRGDLSSELPAGIESGILVELGSVSMVDGREWVEATLPAGEFCYMIGASVRSHAIPVEQEVKAD